MAELSNMSRVALWWLLKLSLGGVSIALLIGALLVLVNLLELRTFAGKHLKDSFRPEKRQPSCLVPVWYDFPDELPFGNPWGSRGIQLVVLLVSIKLLGLAGTATACILKPKEIIYNAIWLFVTYLQLTICQDGWKTPRKQYHREIRVNLKAIIRDYYRIVPGNAQTAAFNIIMILNDCCGVDGAMDFSQSFLQVDFKKGVNPYIDLPSYPSKPSWLSRYPIQLPGVTYNATLPIPPACCKDSIFRSPNVTERFFRAVQCAMVTNLTDINHQGCYAKMYAKYESMCRNLFLKAAVLMLVQYGLLLASFTFLMLSEGECRYYLTNMNLLSPSLSSVTSSSTENYNECCVQLAGINCDRKHMRYSNHNT